MFPFVLHYYVIVSLTHALRMCVYHIYNKDYIHTCVHQNVTINICRFLYAFAYGYQISFKWATPVES